MTGATAMALVNPPVSPGNTRMCVLPFTTPSIEPEGGVRLCSAASIFDYLDETMMGNIHEGGLVEVWRNAKFQNLRRSLLTGNGLRPYCNQCEYRFEGPPWLITFHLALLAYNRARTADPAIANLVLRYRNHYDEYAKIAVPHGLWVEPYPPGLQRRAALVCDLLDGAERVLEFTGSQTWSDLTVPIPPALAKQLAKSSGVALAIRWRNLLDGQVASAAPNVRVSLEEQDLNRIAYAFQPVAEGLSVDASFPLGAMELSAGDFALRNVVRLRVGGFGAAGTAIAIEELSLVGGMEGDDASAAAGVEALVTGSATPVDIDLNTLNRCNVSCVMCPYAIKYDDHNEAKQPLYRLTLDEYKTIVDGMNVASAHFVGAYAEPLMNKELFAMLDYARTQGSKTAVTSNATLLSRTFADKLIDAGLGLLTISLHGATKEVAEKIMRNADFDKVVANIKTLQEAKKEKGSKTPVIQINYVGQRDNVQDLPAFMRLAASLGIPSVYFVHLLVTPYVDDKASLVHYPEQLTRAVREAQKLAKKVGVTLYVSSSYTSVIEEFEKSQGLAAAKT